MNELKDLNVGIVGLGYVGLPLAVYMAREFPTVGFDVNETRIAELEKGIDTTNEVTDAEMRQAKHLSYTSAASGLSDCNFYIVAVPTPINISKQPDLTALESASALVGPLLKPNDIVVFESTVFPGATEEICVPILEEKSGLKLNEDFYVGYSPERINPGDHQRRLPDIVKITSGSTPEAANLIDAAYAKIITAGTHLAGSVRVAEAAKVIENIQRDLNIALVNELALLFKKMDIRPRDVLAAAGTKWNFHPYEPGLVGGHCIGVDPYYLTYKAETIGYHPEVILAGRRINDTMASLVCHDIVSVMLKKTASIGEARILMMGFTFKENCPDIRNTKIADLVRELKKFVADVVIYDPYASPKEAQDEYGLDLTNDLPNEKFDGAILAVKHDTIQSLGKDGIRSLLKPETGFIYDIKGILPGDQSDGGLF